MKRTINCVIWAFFSFLVGVCTAGCLVSAYALPVNLWVVALGCAGAAALGAVCFRGKLGLAVPVILAVALYLSFLTVDRNVASVSAFLGFMIPFVVAYVIDKKKKDNLLPEITALICPETETQPCK